MKIIPTYFCGVFSSDTIPIDFHLHNGGYIVNLSKYNSQGTHWVAIIVKEKRVFYCDPLNLPFIPNDIVNRLNMSDHVQTLAYQVQPYNSVYCGFYAMMFVLASYFNINYNLLCSCFPQVSHKNDNVCLDILVMLIRSIIK